MMKKNGFTLAEVLITLAIIGVVATLTLPSLMNNTQEQQSVTGYKKAINTLNEAVQMAAAVDGFDFSTVTEAGEPSKVYDTTTGQLNATAWAIVASKTNVTTESLDTTIDKVANKFYLFRDGTALAITNTTEKTADGKDKLDAAGKPIITGYKAYIDTNGKKGPNKVSKCTDSVCNKSGREIYDVFEVSLAGAGALPPSGEDEEARAAQWAWYGYVNAGK